MTRQKLIGGAVALTALAAPALGYALSCAFPMEQAELTEPAEVAFEGVNIRLRAGFREATLEIASADGVSGGIDLTYRLEGVQ